MLHLSVLLVLVVPPADVLAAVQVSVPVSQAPLVMVVSPLVMVMVVSPMSMRRMTRVRWETGTSSTVTKFLGGASSLCEIS